MKNLWIILLAALIIFGGWLLVRKKDTVPEVINNTATTTPVRSNNPNPTASSTLETRTSELIVTSPLRGQVVSSPLTLTGSARGSWYFEASAPVFLTDLNGKVLAQSYVQAEGEWMTTNFVPFKGTLTWPATSTGTSTRGFVVFQNDNPSGLPSLQKEVKIPVTFSR